MWKYYSKLVLFKSLIALILLINATCSVHAQDIQPLKNIAILIPSCDKYSDLWHPFSQLLFKYWPELNNKYPDLNVYLTSNKKSFPHDRIKNILIPHDRSWSDSLRTALQQIEEKYILILLEDYFIHTPVADQELWQAFAVMQQNDAVYLQVSFAVADPDLTVSYPHNIVRKQQYGKFRTSLQAAIWDKQTLLNLLLSGENPWRFEIDGSVRSESIARPFLAMQSEPIKYFNAVNYGIIEMSVLKHLKANEGIDLINRKLTLPRSDFLRFRIKPYKGLIFLGIVFPLLAFILLRTSKRFPPDSIIFLSLIVSMVAGKRYMPMWLWMIVLSSLLCYFLIRKNAYRGND